MNDYERFFAYGKDIITHADFLSQKAFIHHKDITLFDHCIAVAYGAFRWAKRFKLDQRAVVRGALLHDFFLYDWHVEGRKHRRSLLKKHGFTHARQAHHNAQQLFTLSQKESDIILKHMFPLNMRPPRYLESWVVNIVDDLISIRETFPRRKKKTMTIHTFIEIKLKESPQAH